MFSKAASTSSFLNLVRVEAETSSISYLLSLISMV
jgi:hypothetical protein